jgi:LPPG:FO 2-phospho-L-lactate transferase
VIVAPSNPIVSIGPILALTGVREALCERTAPVVAISPIIGGAAVKGPAAAMLASLGHEVSAVGIARMYADFLDVLVIDEQDSSLAAAVNAAGPRAVVAPTLMTGIEKKKRLAQLTLDAVGIDARV